MKIELDPQKLQALQTDFANLLVKAQTITPNNYISKSLFSESQGPSTETSEALLGVLGECSLVMQSIVQKTGFYLENVIDSFTAADQSKAGDMNGAGEHKFVPNTPPKDPSADK